MIPHPSAAATNPSTIAGAQRHQRKALVGRVVSAKMMKTVIVEVERLVRHPVYEHVAPTPFPARSTVAVAALPKNARVEIDITAMRHHTT
jgi:enamine deaminase RidA (YjgF/YER057c/UK114 family)